MDVLMTPSRCSRTVSIAAMFVTMAMWCVGVICVGGTGTVTLRGLTVRHYVSLRTELREISSRLASHGLDYLLDRPNITFFLPNSEAMARFDENQFGYDTNSTTTLRSLLLYHSVQGIVEREGLENYMKLRATTPTQSLLFVNTFTGADGDTIYTINGARILNPGMKTDNGILYIIDRVMSPFGSEKTVTEYERHPDVPYLSFTSITALVEVNPLLFHHGEDPDKFFTVFTPNDSYTYPIPQAAQERFYSDWTLMNNTIKSHIIEDDVLCLPSEGNIPEVTSLNGPMKFTREDGKIYVENNRVRAEVIIPNVPLKNGVLHVIDNLLYFIYNTIYEKLGQSYETRTFRDVAVRAPVFTSILQSDASRLTLFVPDTPAFAKVSPQLQNVILRNQTLLTQLLNAHVIVDQELDMGTLIKMGNVTTLGNRTIRIVPMNNRVYFQHNGMWTRVTRADIGCTNGVVHLLSDVMIDSHLTVWENIESQSELSYVYELMRNHVDVRTALSAEDGSHVTVFLPGTSFLEELPGYSREMLQAGGSRVHEALRGHIVEDAFIGSVDFQDGVQRKLTTKSGEVLYVTRRGQEIFVKGTHVTGSVTVSDIWCSNGVIHIIDNLLHIPTRNALDEMRRREDTRIASMMFAASPQERHLLEGNTSVVSVFVPSDRGLNRIPRERIQTLREINGLLNKFIRAHIVSDQEIYTTSIRSAGEIFKAEEGKIRIAMSRDELFVKNAGVGAWFTKTDIPVTNGVIHVIDGPLWLAYRTVEEMLTTEPELMPFYQLISHLPVTRTTLRSELPVTVFAPSTGYFSSIGTKLTLLKSSEDLQRKIFLGHVIPNLVVNRTYLNPQTNSWHFTTSHNVTFRFKKETQDSFGVGVYRDYSVAVSKTQIRCTDGVIYIIDDLLNFSPYTARELSEREPDLRDVFHTLVLRWWQRYLADPRTPHTVLAPVDSVTRKQGPAVELLMGDTQYIQQVTWRHVLLGEILTLEDLLIRTRSNNFTQNNVTFSRLGQDVFVTWGKVRGRIVRSNILTTHGIVHIVDKVLFITDTSATSNTPDTARTTTTQKARTEQSKVEDNSASSVGNVCMYLLALAQCFLMMTKAVV